MFTSLNRIAGNSPKKKRRQKNISRKNRAFRDGRSLRMESLEERRVLTLLGVAPVGLPSIDYNVDGSVSYDATSDAFSVDATPISIMSSGNPDGFFFTGDIDINIEVDDSGALVGGSAGHDFVITGDVDIDGDFIVDESGELLTGEIVAFGHEDSGGSTDLYDFRFAITGGLLTTNALTGAQYAGKDIAVTTTSEASTFTGDFSVDFGGNAKGEVGTTDLIQQGTPDLKLEKFTNGVDADLPGDAPEINAGDAVTFTYLLENTGDVDFDIADIDIVDDNGTPGNLADDVSFANGDLVLIPVSDTGTVGVLEAGETWQLEYSTTAQDLTTLGAPIAVDFDTLSAGDILDGGNQPYQAGFGLTIESSNASKPAMVFDSNNPTGGDTDLATPGYHATNTTALNNLLIVSEDGDQSDPDDNAGGGTLTFNWDEPVTIDSVTMVDIDSNEAGGSIATFYDASGGLISSVAIPALGDNSVQTIDINVDDVARMDINLVSSGAVAEVVFRESEIGIYKNTAVATAPDATDMDMSHYTNPEEPIVPSDAPHITYNSNGTVNYDSTTDVFSLDATPLAIGDVPAPAGFFFSGDFDINIVVDDTGTLLSGIAGDDLTLVGDVDLDGDFIVDHSGVLLTGEVISFDSTDSGGSTDFYEFRFTVTGGLLAPLYAGQELKVLTTSEGSSFEGDFTVDFAGLAKGDIWPMESQADLRASVGNYVFIDNDANGLQNVGDQGINGITVNLLNDQNMVIASTVTDFDADGNAGFYLFYNLAEGDYIVEFEVPEGVTFTSQDAGDDTRDSDVDVSTGQTGLISLADGEHRRDVDAGVLATVTQESMVYSVQDYVNYCQNKKAGKVKSLDLQYSEELDELYVSVDFKAYRGRLTDGFTIVITGGEWPAGTEDKYAIFYFDADIRNRNGGPVLNVFGYNGKYNGKSYRDSDGNGSTYDPDRIATSLDNSSGWVKDLEVETYRVHGRWHRTMTFRIAASAVNSHVPLQGGAWEGGQFGNMVSFALDTYDGLYTKYNNDGFLKKWKACRHGWMDGDWVSTTCEVVETQVPIEDFFNDFGWVVTDYVEGTSDGDPPVDENDEISDFQWAGSVDAALEELFV